MSSVALWYQLEPHQPWPALPAGPDRLPFTDHLVCKGWEAVKTARHSEHPLQEQTLPKATDGRQLWFRPAEEKAWVEMGFTVETKDATELVARLTQARNYGKYRLKLDGRELGVVDLYSPDIQFTSFHWPVAALAPGEHLMRFECVGKSGASAGYFLGLDSLQVRVPVYSRPANVDLRTLQKPKQN